MPNNQLVEELHKSIIRKCKKQRVHSSFKDKIWDAYLADMQVIRVNIIEDFDFYYVLLIFLVNIHGLLM